MHAGIYNQDLHSFAPSGPRDIFPTLPILALTSNVCPAGVQEAVLLPVPAPGRLLHPQLLQGREELQGHQRLHLPGLLHRRGPGTGPPLW